MKNQIQTGEIITLAAPYAVTSGGGAKIGSLFGVATTTLASGAVGAFITVGVVDIGKTASQAWTVGAKIYWDDSTKLCTTTAASNLLIGVAIVAVGSGAGEIIGRVRLSGAFTI